MITVTLGTKRAKIDYSELVELLDESNLYYTLLKDSIEVAGPTHSFTLKVDYNG